MKTIHARNVHQAFGLGLELLRAEGVQRDSRNGPVLVHPEPVATVYERPSEKLVLYPERDVNIAFLVYEALWMLEGRNDLEPITRYVKDFGKYSDDGLTLNGAYGHRWRRRWRDQLGMIAERLKKDPNDRRSVLQMWDASKDLGSPSKDVPCNTMATFQISTSGKLDLTVFCRSNDVIWGAYFANAFHFACLLEYMASKIGVPVGTYTQISVNFHAYLDVLVKTSLVEQTQPYMEDIFPISLAIVPSEKIDAQINAVLRAADTGKFEFTESLHPTLQIAANVLFAHHVWRTTKSAEAAMMCLGLPPFSNDWEHAMQGWLTRRHVRQQRSGNPV